MFPAFKGLFQFSSSGFYIFLKSFFFKSEPKNSRNDHKIVITVWKYRNTAKIIIR